jgi:lysozyme family protein
VTVEDVLDGVLAREGGWRDTVQRPDGSWDPPTNLGITLPVLQEWSTSKGLTSPVTMDHLRGLLPSIAKNIYETNYILKPGFTPGNILYEPLRVQLIDFGVNSGPERAIRWLQRVLGMFGPAVTGQLDENTRGRLDAICGSWYGFDATRFRLVNDALVAARAYMIDQAVDHGTIRRADEEGLESRALSFFRATP